MLSFLIFLSGSITTRSERSSNGINNFKKVLVSCFFCIHSILVFLILLDVSRVTFNNTTLHKTNFATVYWPNAAQYFYCIVTMRFKANLNFGYLYYYSQPVARWNWKQTRFDFVRFKNLHEYFLLGTRMYGMH